MNPSLPKSFVFAHDELGRVHVTRRASSSRVSGRWKDGCAYFNVPEFLNSVQILESVDRLAPGMLARKSEIRFFDGQRVELPGLTFVISSQTVRPDELLCTLRDAVAYIEVGSNMEFNQEATSGAISRMMRSVAVRTAPGILIPDAVEVASRLGIKVRSWSIMNGQHVLGRCSSTGHIQLSSMNVFLPMELREYIVCHELAHLTEMNHSKRFHLLCDSYCGGHEAALSRALNSYRWPLLRR